MTTERLTIRRLLVEDITPAYVESLNDPTVVRWTGARHLTWTRENVTDYVRRCNVDGVSHLLGIFTKPSGTHIGNIRLFNFSRHHRRAELAFMIFDRSEWSKGYATEAVEAVSAYGFGTLGLHRICADYYAVNTASARLFAKAGFAIEGMFKDHFLLDGTYIDSVRVACVNSQPETS